MTELATILVKSRPALMRLGILALTLALGVWLLDHWRLRELMEPQWIDSQIKQQGWWGPLLFVAVAALSMTVGLPRQISAGLAGYAFGLGLGTVFALIASALAATGGFYYARYMGRLWLTKRFPKTTQRLDQFLSQDTFATVLALRLSPLGNNLATNLAAGVSGAPFVPFILGSVLGYLPQTLAFALLGQGEKIDPLIKTMLVIGLIMVSCGLGIYLWWKNSARYEKGQGAADEAA